MKILFHRLYHLLAKCQREWKWREENLENYSQYIEVQQSTAEEGAVPDITTRSALCGDGR